MHKMMWSNATVVVWYVSFCVSVCGNSSALLLSLVRHLILLF